MSDNHDTNVQKAVAYLGKSYSENIGLLYESPDGTRTVEGSSWQLRQTYWTQTDNFLAALALRPYNPTLSESIRAAIAGYLVPSASKPSAIAVLEGKVIPEGAKAARTTIEITADDHIILTEVQDGADIPDWTEYGNLLAFQSLSRWLQGNEREALRLYFRFIGQWDGHGIDDRTARTDGRYAVYKIALALLLSKIYEDDLSGVR